MLILDQEDDYNRSFHIFPLTYSLLSIFTPSCIIFLQRHKLGSNLTPVTPESFAKWKATRMDKKKAEQEALKKAKDVQAAAGKNTGMSGRDLVRFLFSPSFLPCFIVICFNA